MKLALWAYESPAHIGVAKAVASFSGIHCVLRAPKGDGYGTIMMAMFERLGVTPPLSVSAMSEATLAGAAANLPPLLQEIDRRHAPELIVITRSATAAVLQEPLDGELAMMPAGTLKAEVALSAVHPVRDTELSAFGKATREIVERFATDVKRTERPTANIIGPSLLGFHDRANVTALRRALEAIGIGINVVLPLGASPEDLRGIGRAWVNIPTAIELAQPTLDFLQARFGTPFSRELPYGEAGTTRFLRELCGICELANAPVAEAARASQLLWYARTVDAHALSSKRVMIFGAPTAAAGIARVMREELDMHVELVGTYALGWGDWLRERVAGLGAEVLVTDDYRAVAREIDARRPDIVFGSQMERHSASGFGVPCAVVSPPSHILNFPLGYSPFMGFDGANHLGDLVNATQVLGLEHHLIETFGPRGQGRFAEAAPEPEAAIPTVALQPVDGVAEQGSVATADAPAAIAWDTDAEKLLGRVPFFVRKKARANIERYARERGITLVDEAVMLRAREHVGG